MPRTFASVTDMGCACGYFEKAAKEPNSPIEFVPKDNRYRIEYRTGNGYGRLDAYHCIFCGGIVPKPESEKDGR